MEEKNKQNLLYDLLKWGRNLSSDIRYLQYALDLKFSVKLERISYRRKASTILFGWVF